MMNFNNTGYGVKLFDMNLATGKLYPLFINSDKEIPVGEWMIAENHPTKGFAKRPGWHIGLTPDAPWLRSKDGTYKSKKGKRYTRVFALVKFPVDVNYQPLADESPTKDLPDTIPLNGYYKFKEGSRGDWIIAGACKIERIMSWSEVDTILRTMGYDSEKAFEPYKRAFEKRAETLRRKKQG